METTENIVVKKPMKRKTNTIVTFGISWKRISMQIHVPKCWIFWVSATIDVMAHRIRYRHDDSILSLHLGYNTDDIQTKFNKIVEKNADDDIDDVNKKLADLGRVSEHFCFLFCLF